MQSVSNYLTTAIVVVFLWPVAGITSVISVPSEAATIQAALDAISANDTILVSEDLYAEELIAPEFGFTLMGDVEPDSGLFHRPIVDPSTLSMPTARTCLSNLHDYVVIQKMWFRNGAAMFPRDNGAIGGIMNETANLFILDCVFDSTYKSVTSYWNPVRLERCIFRSSTGHCVYVGNDSLVARDCDFECLETDWACVKGGTGTIIERCHLHGDMGLHDWWLSVYGAYWQIADNVFGPGGGSRQTLFNVGGTGGVFERNLITDCRARGHLITVRPQCEGTVIVRNNLFTQNTIQGEAWAGTMCMSVSAQYDSFTLCSQALITDNTFLDNRGGSVVKGISTGGYDIVTRNRFIGLDPDTQWTYMQASGIPTLQDNIFIDNGKGAFVAFGLELNAEHNYWGHESGPFHPFLNQWGQGDEVGDNVDFEPWYTDTLFMTSAIEPRPPLPVKASLIAYPNPFNAVTTIQLALPRAGIARIDLFDITGRRVKELWSGAVAETREIQFEAAGFASGVYFVRAWDPLGNRLYAATKVVLLK